MQRDDQQRRQPYGAAPEGDPLRLADASAWTGILVALGLATLASFSLDAGPRFTLLILSVIAVVTRARLLVSAIKLAQIDSQWRALGVAGMVVGVVATIAALAVVAFILIGAGATAGAAGCLRPSRHTCGR